MINRIGILSDIHGNSLALEAVIEDLEKNQVGTILNLGDSLYGPLNPVGTFQLISERPFISISGNQDRFILENEVQNDNSNPTLSFVQNSLNREAIDWLKKLKQDFVWNNIYLCHGNLVKDDVPLLEKFNNGEVVQKSVIELENEVKNTRQNIILCGHTHVPKIVNLLNADKFIINPGSVGLPAYDDDYPFYHKMESHSPLAKYVILEQEEEKVICINQRHLRYDFEGAARQAEKNGRPDWAYWIRHGRVK